MASAESIVAIDIRHAGEFSRKARFALFLARVESQVLKQKHVTGFQTGYLAFRILTDRVGREADLLTQDLTQTLCYVDQ